MEGHKSWKIKNTPKRGTRRNQILEPFPPIVISILDKERGGTPRKILDL
jgi:hypothetical protein